MNYNHENKGSSKRPGTPSSFGPASEMKPVSGAATWASTPIEEPSARSVGPPGRRYRLARLPDWLRAYVRIDGEAVVRDFESAGHFHVYDAPEGGGTFVFDAYEWPTD